MTGLPAAIASAIVNPSPSERCSDVAVAPPDERVLLRRRVVAVDQADVWPIADLARRRSRSLRRRWPLIVLITSIGPLSGSNACAKARTSASGFFRSKTLRKSKLKRNRKRSSGRPRRSRVISGEGCGIRTGTGTVNTGFRPALRIASATKSVAATCRPRRTPRKRGGNRSTSQNQ